MIDERYHIYSIAAVFLALAVGIVIGISMARSPASHGGQSTIRQYEKWMGKLRTEIERTTTEAAKSTAVAARCEEFCQAVLPIVARDRLAWRNIAIVRTGDYSDLAGAVKRALEMAGARVVTVTEVSRNFPFEDDAKIHQVLANCGVWFSPEEIRPRDKLWGIIASAITQAQNKALLPKLESAGVARFTGDYGIQCRLVVVVGGSDTPEKNWARIVDSALLAQLDRPALTVVACEGSQAAGSYVPTWKEKGIATVDNVDSAMGQIALICALRGERANFGMKETADRFVPQTLEAE